MLMQLFAMTSLGLFFAALVVAFMRIQRDKQRALDAERRSAGK